MKWKKGVRSLMYIALGGILFNVVFAIGMSIFNGRQQDNLHFDKHVKYIMPDIVESIESFKSYEGFYPTSLDVFTGKSAVSGEADLDRDTIDRLYYEVVAGGRNYYLLGIGLDNKPFTADDILPRR